MVSRAYLPVVLPQHQANQFSIATRVQASRQHSKYSSPDIRRRIHPPMQTSRPFGSLPLSSPTERVVYWPLVHMDCGSFGMRPRVSPHTSRPTHSLPTTGLSWRITPTFGSHVNGNWMRWLRHRVLRRASLS